MISLVGTVTVIISSIFLFYTYSHPDDNKDIIGWVGRVVVMLSFSVIFGLVLLLPLDIANARSNGGLNMEFFYMFLLIILFLLLVFFVPFVMFLYETDEELPIMNRMLKSLCYVSFLIIIVIILSLLAFGLMSKAELCESKVS